MKFCSKCGTQMNDSDNYCPACGAYNGSRNSETKDNDHNGFWSDDMKGVFNTDGYNISPKSRLVAGLLAFFFGGLGIHQFYLGKTKSGVLMLVFCWTFIPAIIAIVHFILILMGSATDGEGRPVKAW